MRRKKYKPGLVTDGVTRTAVPTRQPQSGPFPRVQAPTQTMVMPNTSSFQVTGNGMPMGLPTYTSIDEYGRAFTPTITYGPQTHSGPVPIPKPAEIVQLPPIVTPISLHVRDGGNDEYQD